MKNLFLIIILLPFVSISQNIKGIVLNKKNNLPIQFTNISLNQNDNNTTTDENGKFELKQLNQVQDKDTLYISHIGYISKKISVNDFKKNKTIIYLDEKIEHLNELTITSTFAKEKKSKLNYTKLAPLQYPISSFGALLNQNKLFIIGGDGSFKNDAWKKVSYEKPGFELEDYLKELRYEFSGQYYKQNLLIYDINTNQWDTSTIKFKKRAYHNINIYNNTIFVLGGKNISKNGKFEYLEDKIEVFDTKSETITIDNTNPHQAANFASFVYNGTIITIGGSVKMKENKTKIYTNKVHSYDINSGYWYELKNMPIAKETNGVLIKDKIYLIGGFNGKELNAIESFDLLTETWKTEGELFNSMSYPAITNNNELIYFFENEKIYTYNSDTKELIEYLINLQLRDSKLFYYNNKLYLVGGYLENYYSQYPSPNLYSIDLEEFENTNPNKIKTL